MVTELKEGAREYIVVLIDCVTTESRALGSLRSLDTIPCGTARKCLLDFISNACNNLDSADVGMAVSTVG